VDRLPGGNALVTSSPARKVYEVDPSGEIAWTLELTDSASTSTVAIYRADRVQLVTGPIDDASDPCSAPPDAGMDAPVTDAGSDGFASEVGADGAVPDATTPDAAPMDSADAAPDASTGAGGESGASAGG